MSVAATIISAVQVIIQITSFCSKPELNSFGFVELNR